jgi:hypothetical protein
MVSSNSEAIYINRITFSLSPPHRGGPVFEPGSGHVGFCGGQSGAGAGFLQLLRFLLPIFIPPIAPKIILIYHLGSVQ